ncbi:hypothetical protein [Fuscovulum blasticum]|uniref:hypothetical protein n=1 Tax=Fuscovulum blasticum TaxID=1075 RepID=UPI000F4D6CE6|nr:hypothetical protein [Fuscovulum blasticum]
MLLGALSRRWTQQSKSSTVQREQRGEDLKHPKIAIGITTYEDISSVATGLAVYELLLELGGKLQPEFVNWHEPVNIPVADRETWSRYWSIDAMTRIEGGATELKFGPIWRRRTSLASTGSVTHGNRSGRDAASTFQLSAKMAGSVDWLQLFSKLCTILKPAYGMLHCFPPEEVKRLDYLSFNGPVAGEIAFTARIASDGNLVRPDKQRRTFPRQFTYLPELSWANYFGPEWAGTYDVEGVIGRAHRAWRDENGVLIQVSENFADVSKNHVTFNKQRDLLRSCFVPGTFRTVLPA